MKQPPPWFIEFLREEERSTRPEAGDGPLTSEVKGILRGALTPEQAVELWDEVGKS